MRHFMCLVAIGALSIAFTFANAKTGFGGAYDGGGGQVGGAPMADKDGDLGFAEGKPYSTGGVSEGSKPQGKGMGGAGKGQGGKGRGDGSGPWGSKGAMGGQQGKGLR